MVPQSHLQQSKPNARNRWMHYYMEDCVGGGWLLVKVMEPVRFLECEVSSFFLFILWQLPFLCLFSTFSPCSGSNFKLQQPVYSPVPRWLSFLSSLFSSWPGNLPPSSCVSLLHFSLSSGISPYSTSFIYSFFHFHSVAFLFSFTLTSQWELHTPVTWLAPLLSLRTNHHTRHLLCDSASVCSW